MSAAPKLVLDIPGYVCAPWNTGDNCRDGDAVGVFRSDCSLICSVHIDGEYGDAEELRRAVTAARLIAAAPRMFERIAKLAADGDTEAQSIVEDVNGRA